jgi:asparagine synthase (glutamine-hydrolysing)
VSEQASNDESIYAKQVVDRCGLRWLRVRPSYEDFAETLPAVVRAQEEPYGSPSINMQWFVMRTARENGVTVLLDGQGGDETLLGYEKYFVSYYSALVRRHGYLAAFRGLRDAGRNNAKMNLRNTLKFLAGGMSARARFFVYRNRNRHIRYSGGVPWFLSALAREVANDFGLQRLEIERTNLPILLRYEDKNSMAHSIETRLPFLDYRAVETALSIPTEYKIQSGWTKWILRTAMKDVLPESIAWRRNKMGFEAPENVWLPRHDPQMWELVSASPLIGALTHPGRLRSAYPTLDLRSKWRLYSVALWEQAFGVGL